MTSQPLPERPNIEQLKKQAKSLLRAARANDPAALQRFQSLPALTGKSVAELAEIGLALHDAQSVVARQYGFKSWNELRDYVEEQSLSFAAAVEEFVRCATGGASARALRLLALHPSIGHADLYAELVLGDSEAVDARLQEDPEAAVRQGGVRNWEALLYVCHTCLHHGVPEREAGLVAIARRLLERGANPNADYGFHGIPSFRAHHFGERYVWLRTFRSPKCYLKAERIRQTVYRRTSLREPAISLLWNSFIVFVSMSTA